jgi:tetratricopeptide (TPR) repeat protein
VDQAEVEALIGNHRYEEAARMLEAALPDLRRYRDVDTLLGALGNLGICYYECERLPEARAVLDEGVDLARKFQPWRVRLIGHELALVLARQGQLDEAIELAKEVLQLELQAGGEGGASMHSLAVFYQLAGRHDEALEVLELVREGCEARHDLEGLGKCLHELGMVHFNLKETRSAVRFWVDSIELKRRLNNTRGLQFTLGVLQAELRRDPRLANDAMIGAELHRLHRILG